MLEIPSITHMMELPLMTTGEPPSIRMMERRNRVLPQNVHRHLYSSSLKDLSLYYCSIDGRADEAGLGEVRWVDRREMQVATIIHIIYLWLGL